ncbi:undecaprenyldiphospho-muramoylpentapeptide beta-N-acetylglucosaminyltransferase [Alphaproteobacteria bacterium]|nr:undecaprenyldiphospho-muramoylpentapeptide beta-N-acetylglucosaminyltransferase [Alphaproteobacteria bacterium]
MAHKESPFVLISAGGTGGHMTPAQALACDLKSRGYRVELVTDSRGRSYAKMFEGIPIHVSRSGTLGAGLLGKVKGILNLTLGILHASSLLSKLKPDLVVGFGGYPSFPLVYAAQKKKIKTVLHEQNAIIGKANAMLVDKATRIAVSLPKVQGLDKDEEIRAVFTGNPVRPEIAALYTKPYPSLEQDGIIRIFVIGGSLGARVFSDVLPKAFGALSEDYRRRLKIVQQCREEDLENVKKSYEENNIDAILAPFFDNVASELDQCHLVIARSGASTVAEITTAGRPAIFVPYPHHKDQQQKMNADAVADIGGAWVMTENGFTVEALRARIEGFLQNPYVLFKAAEKSQSCGKPDAAKKLGNLITALISGFDEY